MSLNNPKNQDTTFLRRPYDVCFMCSGKIGEKQFAIEWTGVASINSEKRSEYVNIWLHPECATVMVLQLASDITKQPPAQHNSNEPNRVVDSLRNIKNIYAIKD